MNTQQHLITNSLTWKEIELDCLSQVFVGNFFNCYFLKANSLF